MCSIYDTELVCQSGGVCQWSNAACAPRFTLDDGDFGQGSDISFWHSTGSMTVIEAENVCVSLCDANGRQGRLARITTEDEHNRALLLKNSIYASYVDGSDADIEGTWAWEDGTPFWTEADGCLQAYCGWNTGEPNDVGNEHYRTLARYLMNDVTGTASSRFFCEFPCLTDFDCPEAQNAAGCPYVCNANGRCALNEDQCCSLDTKLACVRSDAPLCRWDVTVDACVDRACKYQTAGDCNTDVGCKWNAVCNQCAEERCTTTDSTLCAADKLCSWDGAACTVSAVASGCVEFPSESCCLQNAGCRWDRENVCLNKPNTACEQASATACNFPSQGACDGDLSSVKATTVDAENICVSLCDDKGRHGRLARATSRLEIDRLQRLRGGPGSAHLDGSDAENEGLWTWSDGTPFWSNELGCLIDFCPWGSGQPDDYSTGEHYLILWDNGRLNDDTTERVEFFFCEFPCADDSDCPATNEDNCPYVCGTFGRCILSDDSCCGFERKSTCVRSDEPLCQWDETALSCVDRPCQYPTAGPCGADPQCEWNTQCTNDQICAMKRCTASDETSCVAETLCRWSTASSGCVPTDEADGCVQFPTQSCCEQNQLCMWDSTNVCLRVPDDTCTRAAAAMCSPYTVEGDCSSDAVCKWEGNTCVPKYRSDVDGMLESNDYGVLQFWYSKNISVVFEDAKAICGSMCHYGRQGRLARTVSHMEIVRLDHLRPTMQSSWIDGTDKGHEGEWQWSDGTHHVEFNGLWNDVGPSGEKSFICEFPCLVDTQCPEEWECQQGRCVHGSTCNSAEICSMYETEDVCARGEVCWWRNNACEARYTWESGIMEPGNRTDIQFWYSGLTTNVDKEFLVEAENVCLSVCNANGRRGRLARITTKDEFDRVLQLIGPITQSTYFDGSDADIEGVWAWADGTPFWTEADGCLQAFCGWNQGEPNDVGDEHYMEIGTSPTWNDIPGDNPFRRRAFLCDFPCLTDFDCPAAENEAGCPYSCDGNGRCALRADRCCSYDKEFSCVTTKKALCKWDEAGVCVDRPCKYDVSTDCIGDTGCEWNAQCAQCAEKRCTTTDSTLCTADKLCSWNGAACALSAVASGCVQFPSQSCCLQNAGCRWDRENVCLKKPNTACEQASANECTFYLSSQVACDGDLRCAWDGGCKPKYSYFDDGVIEEIDYRDIHYWHSKMVEANVADAQLICGSLCSDDIEGTWAWSDGTPFWSEDSGCLIDYCAWNNNEPNDWGDGEHYLGLYDNGRLNDHKGTDALFFFCEFPCADDSDCPATTDDGCPIMCSPWGRCVPTTDMCCGFERKSKCVSSDEPLCQWDATAQACVDRSCQYPTSGACTADPQCEWNTQCTNDQMCAVKRCTASDESSCRVQVEHCVVGWNQGEPNDVGDEHYMEIGTSPTWNDIPGDNPFRRRAFLCDFPCLTDFDCPAAENEAGCPYSCDGNGRCALRADRCCSYDKEFSCVTTKKALCKWDEAGVCVDRPCKYDVSTDCIGDTGCEWNAQCAQCAEKRCTTTDSTLCTADKLCSWNGAACALSAVASGCVQFPSQSCCLQNAGCRWDRENVCLKKPNTACEQASANECTFYLSSQVACDGDLRCAWDGGCKPKYSYFDDGVIEEIDYRDIHYWHSKMVEANVADAQLICGSLCSDVVE
ncbi:hypothetical protein DIPPA_08832 [Diplonema papillatum]|nr:hypothetical protein DIPPA_08832 [Diplonema papillatum]